jgi:cellulose synthase/poly-beta-1,6-N-acetylglucosamine synthase-like glycosyltransferase
MDWAELPVLIIYAIAMSFIFVYSIVQLHLAVIYARSRNKKQSTPVMNGNRPFVTIQLPVYNELYVIERLMESVAAFNYPKERFEIQVLDDSTDETVEVIARKVAALTELGIQIEHVRRPERTGYKAGALAYGTERARGEFIAIFDADFIPDRDFLQNTLPYFEDEQIGLVQTRWGHINKDYGFLTKLQAFGLDAHFSVEQSARNAHNHFMNFNGTAGIWRKTTINEAGGWHSDTLTEDLDLSYRAQLKGWRFKFLEDIESPAELPAVMQAIRAQQYRWTKGGAETARKNLGNVWRSNIPFLSKIHAMFHLMNGTIFVCIMLTALLSVPILFFKKDTQYEMLFTIAPILLFSLLFLSFFYWMSIRRHGHGAVKTTGIFLGRFPAFLSVSMGLSLYNAIAVTEGYLGRKSPFVRTPKYKLEDNKDGWAGKKYTTSRISLLTWVEILLIAYFISGIYFAFILDDFGLLPFHIMLIFGFGTIVYYSLRQSFGRS